MSASFAALLEVNFDVNQVIKDAEAALGKYGPAIWGAAYREVFINALLDVVWGVGLGMAAFVAFRFARHFFKTAWVPKKEPFDDHEGEWVMTGLFTLATLLACVLTMVSFTSALDNLLNPTWHALQLLKP